MVSGISSSRDHNGNFVLFVNFIFNDFQRAFQSKPIGLKIEGMLQTPKVDLGSVSLEEALHSVRERQIYKMYIGYLGEWLKEKELGFHGMHIFFLHGRSHFAVTYETERMFERGIWKKPAYMAGEEAQSPAPKTKLKQD